MEQEARQLVEAAARWLAAVPDAGAYADRTGEQDDGAQGSAETEAGFGEHVGADAGGPEAGGREPGGREGGPGGERADGERAGSEHLCRGCPWCRAKAAAGPIGADTLDSIAHLLSAAAESLSLFAQSRRDAQHHDQAGAGSRPHDDGAPSQGKDSQEPHEVPGDSRHDDQSDDSEGAARWA